MFTALWGEPEQHNVFGGYSVSAVDKQSTTHRNHTAAGTEAPQVLPPLSNKYPGIHRCIDLTAWLHKFTMILYMASQLIYIYLVAFNLAAPSTFTCSCGAWQLHVWQLLTDCMCFSFLHGW